MKKPLFPIAVNDIFTFAISVKNNLMMEVRKGSVIILQEGPFSFLLGVR